MPILIGGRSDAALRRVARYGDGWLGLWVSPGRYAAAVELIAKYAADEGRAGAGVAARHARVVRFRPLAACRPGPAGRGDGGVLPDPVRQIRAVLPVRHPADVAAILQAYVDAGCRSFNLIPVADSDQAAIDGAEAVRALEEEQR